MDNFMEKLQAKIPLNEFGGRRSVSPNVTNPINGNSPMNKLSQQEMYSQVGQVDKENYMLRQAIEGKRYELD